MELHSLQEIEQAIEALSPQQREQLSDWFDQRQSEWVEQQMRRDSDSGRFDEWIARAVADHGTGTTKPL